MDMDHPLPTVTESYSKVSMEMLDALMDVGLAILRPSGIVVCLSCQYGVPVDELEGHIGRDHKLTHRQVEGAMTFLGTVPNLLHSYTDFTFPITPPFPEAIDALATLHTASICSLCGHINKHRKHVKNHIDGDHPDDEVDILTGMVQTLFAPRHPGGGGYCRVVPAPPPSPSERPIEELIEEEMAKHRELLDPPIIAIDRHTRDASIFSEKSGFARAIEGINRSQLVALQESYKPTKQMREDVKAIVLLAWDEMTTSNYNARCFIRSPT